MECIIKILVGPEQGGGALQAQPILDTCIGCKQCLHPTGALHKPQQRAQDVDAFGSSTSMPQRQQ